MKIFFLSIFSSHAEQATEFDAVEKHNFEKLNLRNDDRISLLRRGCQIDPDVLQHPINYDFEFLRDLQRNITQEHPKDADFNKPTDEKIRIKNHEELIDLFHIDEYKILTCLPPKTGTTNWQRFFAALQHPGTEPEDFEVPKVFTQLPRVKNHENADTELAKMTDFSKILNVRHPLARLLSAWHQKFHRDFWNVKKYQNLGLRQIEKYEKINFESENGAIYSFGAFLHYVADAADMQKYDYHWQTETFQCMPCQMNYQIITTQETSSSDALFVLEHQSLHGKTHLPGQYADSPLLSESLVSQFSDVPKEIIKKIYQIYYADFMLFGYSIDEFLIDNEVNI